MGWGFPMKNPMRVGRRIGPSFGLAREFAYANRRCFAAIAFIVAIGQIPFSMAQRAEGQGVRVENESRLVRHLQVTLFKSRTLRIDQPFASAVVAAPEIADVLPMSDRSLYIQGKKVGTTNISVFDSSMRIIGVIDVEVAPDTGNLREKIGASAGG